MRSTLGAQAMSENNTSSENTESNEIRDVKSFGFNRAFASRAAAIGLFAVLGTFAVFQSLSGGKKSDDPAALLASNDGAEQAVSAEIETNGEANLKNALLDGSAGGERNTVNVAKIVNNQTSINSEPQQPSGTPNNPNPTNSQFSPSGQSKTPPADNNEPLVESTPNSQSQLTLPKTNPSTIPANQPPASPGSSRAGEFAPFQSNSKLPEKQSPEKQLPENSTTNVQPPPAQSPNKKDETTLPLRTVPSTDAQQNFGTSGNNFQLETNKPSAAPSTIGLAQQITGNNTPLVSGTDSQPSIQAKSTSSPSDSGQATTPNQKFSGNPLPPVGNGGSFNAQATQSEPTARPPTNPVNQTGAGNSPVVSSPNRPLDDNTPMINIAPKSDNRFGNPSTNPPATPNLNPNQNPLPGTSPGLNTLATQTPLGSSLQPPATGQNSIVNNTQNPAKATDAFTQNPGGSIQTPTNGGFPNTTAGNLNNNFSGANQSNPASNPGGLPMANSRLPIASNPPGSPANNLAGTARTVAATLPTPGDRQLEGMQVPTIAIEKIAPPEIQVNQVAAFSIVVRNTGRVPAEDVTVHDQVPSNTQFVNATPQPTANASSNHLMWQLGTLKPGEEKTIQLNLRPTRAGEIGSVAQVTFATRAAVRSTVTEPILAIEHSGPLQSLLGQNVMLDITVHNKGTGVARDVLIQENVPPQLKYSDNFRELEYAVGTLGPGQSKRIQLTLQAAQVGQFRNLVQAVGTGVAAAKHEIDMEVIAPQLKVTSDGPRSRFLKRDTSHRFQVANQGTAAATNVDLIAKLPRGLKFVSANNQGQYDPRSHAVYWSLPELKPTQSASVQLDTLPIETGPQDIEFQAVADLQQKEALTHALAVEHLVDVYFEIDDLDDHIEIGSETRYQVKIVNQGTKPAANIRLMVEFANGVRPTNSSGAAAGEIQGQRIVFTPIASLNPGEEVQVQIVGLGTQPGEHRVSANLQTDGREINITKEESTRVYADR